MFSTFKVAVLLALASLPLFASAVPVAADPLSALVGEFMPPSVMGVVGEAVAIAAAAAAAASGNPTAVICGTTYSSSTQTAHDVTCTFQSVSEHFN